MCMSDGVCVIIHNTIHPTNPIVEPLDSIPQNSFQPR